MSYPLRRKGEVYPWRPAGVSTVSTESQQPRYFSLPGRVSGHLAGDPGDLDAHKRP